MKVTSYLFLALLFPFCFAVTLAVAEDGDSDESKEARAQQHFILGEQFRGSGLYEKAAQEYQRVLEILPENTDAYARLGYVLTEGGKYDEAASVIRELIDQKPDDCTAYESLGYLYLKQAHGMNEPEGELSPEKKELFEEAIAAYQLGLGRCADNVSLHSSLARAYRGVEDQEKAIGALARVVELDPNNALAYEQIAEMRSREKAYSEAIAAYEKLLSLPHGKGPEWVRWAELRVGAMHRKLGQCAEAIPYYERVLAVESSNTHALEGAAVCYEKTSATEQAAAAFEKLLEIKPEKASYHYRLGQLRHDLGQYKTAIKRVKQGLAYEMDCSAYAHYLLGESYEKLRSYPAAKREFERARDCNDPVFHDKAIAQIDRQLQLMKIQELEKKKREQGG